MSFTPLLVLFLQTGVLLLASLVVLWATRRAPAARRAVARITLLWVVVLIALSPWTRQQPKPIVPIQWNPISSEVMSTSEVPQLALTPAKATKQTTFAPTVEQTTPRVSEDSVVELLWLLGCFVSAGVLGFGYWRIFKARRSSVPVSNAAARSILEEVARSAGIKVPCLVTSDSVAGPIVAGVLRPTIFLPAGFLDSAGPDEVGVVLRHEVAHIASGDLGWGLFYRLLCIVAWPQPLIWALGRPMTAASEELCDSQVLATGVPAKSYAETLLRLREKLGSTSSPSLGIGVVSREHSITTRIESILSNRPKRTRMARPAALLLSVAALLTSIGAATVFAVPEQRVHLTPGSLHRLVRLLGPGGKPIANAQAWLQINGKVPQIEFRKLQVTPDGIHVDAKNIPPDTGGTLIVHAPGLALGIVRVWPDVGAISELKLAKSSRADGFLRLADGAPAANVPIRVIRVTEGGPNIETLVFGIFQANSPVKFTTTSDATGAFSIGDLPPGATIGFDVDDDRYAQLRFSDQFKLPADGSTGTGAVKLQAAAQFSGRVIRNGAPVAGIWVGAQSVNRDSAGNPSADAGWGEAVTDADGRYVIKRLPATTYNLALRLDDRQQAEFTAVAQEGVSVTEGQTVERLDFNLILGALIKGSLVDATGKPIPNAEIGVYGPAHPQSGAWVQETSTDTKGHFVFRVPAGDQYVYTMDRGEPNNGTHVNVKGGSMTVVDFRR